jgi:hypothetical protein
VGEGAVSNMAAFVGGAAAAVDPSALPGAHHEVLPLDGQVVRFP